MLSDLVKLKSDMIVVFIIIIVVVVVVVSMIIIFLLLLLLLVVALFSLLLLLGSGNKYVGSNLVTSPKTSELTWLPDQGTWT